MERKIMAEQKTKETADMIQVRQTPPIKMKDVIGRNRVSFKLRQAFGFLPEEIIIQKVYGQNNKIVVMAVITPEMLKEEKLKHPMMKLKSNGAIKPVEEGKKA
jgi:hypothetical protein